MEFDFVIIGGGSAGCVLANRLSACGKHSVALIEAGPRDRNPWIHIPVGYFKTMGNPAIDWCYVTEQDPGLNGRQISWPRGRVLGGSSSINGLLYVRGQPEDFDRWRQLGNAGWSWDDVLPYFKRAETWQDATAANPEEVRGKDGPLSISPTRITREVVDRWIKAAVNAGYKENHDYNGTDQEGVGYFQLTLRGGRRCSSAVAYIKPARKRSNLAILTDTQVERLDIKEGRVTAVLARQKNKRLRIGVRGEAILSAGAIGSPQILMLSGIGDGDELARLGIETQKHLPGVGKNMQDHLQARPIFKTTLPTINIETNNLLKKAMIAMQYALTGHGPMTMAASLGAGFLKTEENLATPDIQFHIQPFSTDALPEGPHPFSAFTASVLQLRPESRGHLKLRSPDPKAYPEIHPNYLATQCDQKTIVKGIQIARKIAEHSPLKECLTEEYAPGKDVGFDDFDAILNWVRNTAVTIYHPTGTCKMGSTPDSVVDPHLKVHKIKGLRIADASIMPEITSGNTNAPTIMIGEKAADMILESAV